MVRALLGSTKTQTRRVVKPGRHVEVTWDSVALGGDPAALPCPYGQPGDRLWVRETSQAIELPSGLDGVRYLADDAFRPIENTRDAAGAWLKMHTYRGGKGLTVPGIHMPRWASRITLELTGVRVERLQDISVADAIAEGVVETNADLRGLEPCMEWYYAYEDLWRQINGPSSWTANPWVWVLEFRRVDQ